MRNIKAYNTDELKKKKSVGQNFTTDAFECREIFEQERKRFDTWSSFFTKQNAGINLIFYFYAVVLVNN